MVIPSNTVPVEVLAITGCSEGRSCPIALIGPHGLGDNEGIVLHLEPNMAHALGHELRGQETIRGGAFAVVRRVIDGMGGKPALICLETAGSLTLLATLFVECDDGRVVEVLMEPGEALGLATCLDLPMVASSAVFRRRILADDFARTQIGAFVSTLDLSGLAADA